MVICIHKKMLKMDRECFTGIVVGYSLFVFLEYKKSGNITYFIEKNIKNKNKKIF